MKSNSEQEQRVSVAIESSTKELLAFVRDLEGHSSLSNTILALIEYKYPDIDERRKRHEQMRRDLMRGAKDEEDE